MRIVVSGTHATGKSTLVASFAAAHPDFVVLDDPAEAFDEAGADAGSFLAQLRLASARLLTRPPAPRLIAERGPLDLLAYLGALDLLRRPGRADVPDLDWMRAADAIATLDLLVLLPLTARDGIHVSDDEDPELREAMDEVLLELADDPDLVGDVPVLELTGPREQRLGRLVEFLRDLA